MNKSEAARVRRARQALDESQKIFGQRMGFSQSAVARWENATLAVPKLVLQECDRILGSRAKEY